MSLTTVSRGWILSTCRILSLAATSAHITPLNKCSPTLARTKKLPPFQDFPAGIYTMRVWRMVYIPAGKSWKGGSFFADISAHEEAATLPGFPSRDIHHAPYSLPNPIMPRVPHHAHNFADDLWLTS